MILGLGLIPSDAIQFASLLISMSVMYHANTGHSWWHKQKSSSRRPGFESCFFQMFQIIFSLFFRLFNINGLRESFYFLNVNSKLYQL